MLVGSVLAYPHNLDEIISIVEPDDFSDPSLAVIFASVADLTRRDKQMDAFAVSVDLESKGSLESVGGRRALEELYSSGLNWVTRHPPMGYAALVKDGSVKRQVNEIVDESKEALKYDSGTSAREGIELLQHSLGNTLYSISDETTITKVKDSVDYYLDLVAERKRIYEENKDENDGLQGIPSNIESLNRYTTGWLPGQLITVAARTSIGKALALDTPIPTPSGWTTMRDLQVGSEVLGMDGKPVFVSAVTGVQNERDCFVLDFSDDSAITADAEHLWLTETWVKDAAGERVRTEESVKTTQQIYDAMHTEGSDEIHSVRIAEPFELENRALLIDPYLLGYWLGKGESASAAMSVPHEGRSDLLLRIKGAGLYYSVTDEDDEQSLVRFSSIPVQRGKFVESRDEMGKRLRALSLDKNKHIPQAYMRASRNQRQELLDGILDSHGIISADGARSFIAADNRLAEDVSELIRTLGHIAHITEEPSTGEHGETIFDYRVSFTPKDDAQPETARVYIRAIEQTASVPVKCIQVDNADHMYLAGTTMIPTHNTVMAVNSAVAAARANKSVMFFSLEMQADEIQDRIYSSISNVPMKELKQGTMSKEHEERLMDSIDEFRELKITIDVDPEVTVDNIRAKAIKQAQSEEGLDMIIVDYLQLITPVGKHGSRQEEVRGLSRGMKLLAKQLDVPVMVLAQVNKAKEGEDDTPRMDQIRESYSIAQDSDIVILLHRNIDTDDPDPKTFFILDKNRNGESNKIITCRSDLACSKFEEIRRLKSDGGDFDDPFGDEPTISDEEIAASVESSGEMFDGFDDFGGGGDDFGSFDDFNDFNDDNLDGINYG